MAGKHNQKRHANRFSSPKETFRRLKDDKEGREKFKQSARKRQGTAGGAKSRTLKDFGGLEDMSRSELLTMKARIDKLLEQSSEQNTRLAEERPVIKHGHTVFATGTDPSKKYEMRYEVRSLDDLVTSNTDSGAINKDFPKALQPRDRTRAASQAQISTIAQNIEPDALLDEFKAIDRGTPIIGADNVVESGNGRSMALRRAKAEHPEQYEKYTNRLKQIAEERGIDPGTIDENSVLVRVRTSKEDRVKFAQDANQMSSLGVSDAERSRSDASRITTESLVNLQQRGDISSTIKSDRDFVRGFVANVPENERATMMDKSGKLTQAGENRIKAAMFNRVYDSPELTARVFESTDNDTRNITNGMLNSLGSVGKAEELVRTGQRGKDLSIAEDLTKSVSTFNRLKNDNLSVSDYLAQGQLFGRDLSPSQEKILVELDKRRRSGKKVKELLDSWGDIVQRQPPPAQTSFFGDSAPSKSQLIDQWISQANEPLQAGLF